MNGRILNLTGKRFGRLLVCDLHGMSKHHQAIWRCMCDCGKEHIAFSGNLRNGHCQSCGCLQKESAGNRARTHGMRGTRAYRIWLGMVSRCTNPNATGYKNYGGRGITVCERWKTFENFFSDMGDPPTGTTLDREDNELGYEPGNCRWATATEQANNTRFNRHVTAFGETLTVGQWAKRTGIKYVTLYLRLTIRGWSPEKALTYRVRP